MWCKQLAKQLKLKNCCITGKLGNIHQASEMMGK